LKTSATYDVTDSVEAVTDLVNSTLTTQQRFIVVNIENGGKASIQAPLVSSIADG
jgi:hypothetical protein